MIELSHDQLTFSFPDVHPDARLVIEFQRTLRIPHGGGDMPRLPSLGPYPLYSIADYAHRVPNHWASYGGAMLPMYQSEAMWLSFRPAYSVAHQAFYPFAVKIGVGGVDAVGGQRWSDGIHQWPQDFLVITHQSWLGGYQTGNDGIRQFVAMPLGFGYLPDDSPGSPHRFGRLQLVIYPMGAQSFRARYPLDAWQRHLENIVFPPATQQSEHGVLSPGADALERQSIEEGLFPLADWDVLSPGSYTLHLANSLHWCAITGGPPPMGPARLESNRRAAANGITRTAGLELHRSLGSTTAE